MCDAASHKLCISRKGMRLIMRENTSEKPQGGGALGQTTNVGKKGENLGILEGQIRASG